MRWANFKIFSNHGGQFEYICSYFSWVNLKIFSNQWPWWTIEYIFNHLRWVNSKNFSNHGGQFDNILSHLSHGVLNIMLEVSKFQKCLQPSVHPCLFVLHVAFRIGIHNILLFYILLTSCYENFMCHRVVGSWNYIWISHG